MKFGLSQQITDSTAGTRPYEELLNEIREIAEFADGHGFDSIWTGEHHFDIWGRFMNPNPILLSADLAARTRNLRVGISAVIASFWHPMRLAEDICMLDQLSGGRLEIGFGRGNFGIEAINLNPDANPNDQQANMRIFQESVQVVKTAIRDRIFSFKGDVYQFPRPGFTNDRAFSVKDPSYVDPKTNELLKLTIIPDSKQKPYPPMWAVVSDSAQSLKFAAENDMGVIMWRHPVRSLKQRLGMYRDFYNQKHGANLPLGAKAAIVREIFVADSKAEARRIAEGPMMEMFNVSNWRGPSVFLNPDEKLPEETEAALRKNLTYDFVERSIFFGSPDEVFEQIKHLYEETNIELILFKNAWPALSHEHRMRSTRRIATDVMPRLREWHAKRYGAVAAE
ncbi:MAG: LLM class flavin-dependent oxidoreductase [Pseudorhodoplanes sp.]